MVRNNGKLRRNAHKDVKLPNFSHDAFYQRQRNARNDIKLPKTPYDVEPTDIERPEMALNYWNMFCNDAVDTSASEVNLRRR